MTLHQTGATPAYDLAEVSTASNWRHYHRIRRTVLWDARGRLGYDETHPDDVHPSNHPLLLRLNGRPLGTVRIDDVDHATAIVRLVAIESEQQRQGHGRMLARLVDSYAIRRGLRHLMVYAAEDAVGFYTATGWLSDAQSLPVDQNGVSSILMNRML